MGLRSLREIYDREAKLRRLRRLLAAKNSELCEHELANYALIQRNRELSERLAGFAVVADVKP